MVKDDLMAEPFFFPLFPGLPLTGDEQLFLAHCSSKQLLFPGLQIRHP